MPINTVFFLVEGDDDDRFISGILDRFYKDRFQYKIIKYSQLPKILISKFINTFNVNNEKYFFMRDINSEKCISEKRKSILTIYSPVKLENIIIVVKEIEAWYLAGIDAKISKTLNITNCDNTDIITKEIYFTMIPKNFHKTILFNKIIENYSIDIAKTKNSSFKYFLSKIDQMIL